MDDDDSCVMKYIEIVPLEKSKVNSNATEVKCEPLSVKVGVVFSSSILKSYQYIYIIHTEINSLILYKGQ